MIYVLKFKGFVAQSLNILSNDASKLITTFQYIKGLVN
jgi:hypothetical protein